MDAAPLKREDEPAPAALARAFMQMFGVRPRLFRAPGRINIIGEHTDYAGGFVLPAAIDRAAFVAAAPAPDELTRMVSRTLNEARAVDLEMAAPQGNWSDYVIGVAKALEARGVGVKPLSIMIDTDVPVGAGISSSAALEVASAYAFLAGADAQRDAPTIAAAARTAENDYVGVPCGPMDQIASACGVANHALLVDCRSLAVTPVAVPDTFAFVLIDSGVKHKLADGAYAARRADCEEAAGVLGIPLLRDADEAMLGRLSGRLLMRARHVVRENARVLAAVVALRAGDARTLGALINASHASLKDDFEVTCAETDALQALAAATPGVHGARQMGGGFGGAVLLLCDAALAGAAGAAVADAYKMRVGVETKPLQVRLGRGAGEISP